MIAVNVLPKNYALTEFEYRKLLAKGIRRVSANGGAGRFGLAVGCGEKTMRNARDERTSLQGATAFNMLLQDPSALDEVLAHFGMCIQPIDAEIGPDAQLLADTLALAAYHAEALSDGRIDHIKAARLNKLARPVVREWTARIVREGVA